MRSAALPTSAEESSTAAVFKAARHERWIVAALIAGLTLTWLPRLAGPIDLRWDAAVYYSLGTALAHGDGYRLLNEPADTRVTQYPPVLPAIIAVHERLLGTDDPIVVGHALRYFYLATWIAFLAAVYALLRRRLGFLLTAGATAVCALHPRAISLSDRAYADLPFALCLVLFILVAERRKTRAAEGAAWGIATIAFLTRTSGIALFAAWVIAWLDEQGSEMQNGGI